MLHFLSFVNSYILDSDEIALKSKILFVSDDLLITINLSISIAWKQPIIPTTGEKIPMVEQFSSTKEELNGNKQL